MKDYKLRDLRASHTVGLGSPNYLLWESSNKKKLFFIVRDIPQNYTGCGSCTLYMNRWGTCSCTLYMTFPEIVSWRIPSKGPELWCSKFVSNFLCTKKDPDAERWPIPTCGAAVRSVPTGGWRDRSATAGKWHAHSDAAHWTTKRAIARGCCEHPGGSAKQVSRR
jgi:hypothetical protein